jgi:HD superfamily phosphodiesterase
MAQKSLSTLSTEEIEKELKRREREMSRKLKTLERKREKLLAQLDEIDQQIAEYATELGVSARTKNGRRGRRPRNEASLADSLNKLLKNKSMSVTEAAQAVQEAGYKTTSPNFRTIVNQTLITDDRFKRTGRGRYTVKKNASSAKK